MWGGGPDREIQREKVREGWRVEMAEAATGWWFGRGRGGGGGGGGGGGRREEDSGLRAKTSVLH